MEKLTSGMSIAESVGSSMEKESSGGSSSGGSSKGGSGTSSRPKSGGKGGGKKKKKVFAEDSAESVLPRLKLRIRSNPLIFGLPHVVAKK